VLGKHAPRFSFLVACRKSLPVSTAQILSLKPTVLIKNDKSNFEYVLKVVDTDIPPYHILFDSQKKRVNGIINFGCAGLEDPTIDFGVIMYSYSESFLSRFYQYEI
jgi:hypothetical protein